jgi:phosphoribosylformylglycinamidine (FGAM) synthase-like enzyme
VVLQANPSCRFLHDFMLVLAMCVAAPSQQQQQHQQKQSAECSLIILGYGSDSGRHGVAFASLNCSSTDGDVVISINTTHMERHPVGGSIRTYPPTAVSQPT